ncbi:MAG: hypothetical protein M0Q24_07810 [Sulfurimonas sp.]|uniref:hypothetical protein n=1 Tax=Sulfurimonas sp. TaxID=2022749 RepID=UPI0025DBEE42|nr:hypothetical protein [Sulfurimonas sp.]MCK9491980.1 hypothetical protein [Sulfurimonas sp.]
MKKLFSSIFVLFILAGCISQPAPTRANITPSWIINPNQNDKIGAVGSSMITYDQKRSTQRKLAITRALDELSLQRGVKVQMKLTKEESYKNGSGTTSIKEKANYSANTEITAHIEDVYEDKISGELFIWMVID